MSCKHNRQQKFVSLILQILLPPNIESKGITFVFSGLFSSTLIVVDDNEVEVESAGVFVGDTTLGLMGDGAEDWEGIVELSIVLELEGDGVEIAGVLGGGEFGKGI
jgi:hypothetical protein